eukprot:118336-Chlamydomonas_euryale.AAC.5
MAAAAARCRCLGRGHARLLRQQRLVQLLSSHVHPGQLSLQLRHLLTPCMGACKHMCAWCGCLKNGLFINAAETEIVGVGRPMTLSTFTLSGKQLLVTNSW